MTNSVPTSYFSCPTFQPRRTLTCTLSNSYVPENVFSKLHPLDVTCKNVSGVNILSVKKRTGGVAHSTTNFIQGQHGRHKSPSRQDTYLFFLSRKKTASQRRTLQAFFLQLFLLRLFVVADTTSIAGRDEVMLQCHLPISVVGSDGVLRLASNCQCQVWYMKQL